MYREPGLPSVHEIARQLPGGRVGRRGQVEFQDPWEPKKNRRPCAFWLTPDDPNNPFKVHSQNPKHDPIKLKDHVRELVPSLGPFTLRRRNSGNGKGHRPAGGPIVQEAAAKAVVPIGEGGAKPARLPQSTKVSRIYLVPFADIRLDTSRRDVIEGLVPRGIVLVWGTPKSGKSFFTLDFAMHIALGWEYRGRRVQQGAVVYCYFEGQKAAGKRKEAFLQRFMSEDAADVPFYLMPVRIDLVAEHQELIAAIKTQLVTTNPILVVIDTLNRSYAGSESSDEDMSNYVKAADAIHEAFDCALAIVHHCGHDKKRPRGHTAITGAADAVIQIRKETDEGHFVALLEDMKDGPAGAILANRLVQVEVGVAADGKPITSCVIEALDISATPQKRKPPRLTPSAQIALDALKAALAEHGAAPAVPNHIPANTLTVSLGLWRRHVYQRDPDTNSDSRKKSFQRSRQALQRHGLVGVWSAENSREEDAECWLIS